jgi:hypothetical protein
MQSRIVVNVVCFLLLNEQVRLDSVHLEGACRQRVTAITGHHSVSDREEQSDK